MSFGTQGHTIQLPRCPRADTYNCHHAWLISLERHQGFYKNGKPKPQKIKATCKNCRFSLVKGWNPDWGFYKGEK